MFPPSSRYKFERGRRGQSALDGQKTKRDEGRQRPNGLVYGLAGAAAWMPGVDGDGRWSMVGGASGYDGEDWHAPSRSECGQTGISSVLCFGLNDVCMDDKYTLDVR